MSYLLKDSQPEWLVADQHGLFAMGTATGLRTRKYHSFLSSIAGRGELNYLAHLDLSIFGQGLWTHEYATREGSVFHPNGNELLKSFSAEPYPEWTWALSQGVLRATLTPFSRGGFEFKLGWVGNHSTSADVVITPFWAMRPLHGLGGRSVDVIADNKVLRVQAREGEASLSIFSSGSFKWIAEQTWYRNFLYREEKARGYDSVEDLYCAGKMQISIPHGKPVTLALTLEEAAPKKHRKAVQAPAQALNDFMVHDPEGVVAGYPWFGEWGRDTFISLPGIVAGVPKSTVWAMRVLKRWSDWIEREGFLPNVITASGPQWESSDATLWWTHSLASIWSMALTAPEWGFLPAEMNREFSKSLDIAIESIRSGKHRHLSLRPDGLLEVTSPHSTWMDARVNDEAVTPRLGVLPEINALWIQAQCLRSIWRDKPSEIAGSIKTVAQIALERCRENVDEMLRPNFVFLHSLPLAPSFITQNNSALLKDVDFLQREFCTPVGLRTLSPRSPAYQPNYLGDQEKRDRGYHQGPVWGWLKGAYDIAAHRAGCVVANEPTTPLSSISGHFAELFDAEKPFHFRGAPAQAWSLACKEEAEFFRKRNVDEQLRKYLENNA